MPTTFNVISLGNFASIDPTEGNTQSENAASLVGQTFGGPGAALVNDFASFTSTGVGFSGGNATAYDMNNNASNDTFSIDGGAAQTFDGTAVYNATVTYLDGTTGTFTAVVFQDTAGNTYLSPEFSANADMTVLEAGPIQSLTLNSLAGNNYSGMTGSRETWNYVTCFTPGALICTPRGYVAVENLVEGDTVMTRDRGIQPIRWISSATRKAVDGLVPIRIRAGSLGKGLPERDLVVSQQHRMLLSSKIADRMFGTHEVLLPAKKLLGLPGIELDHSYDEVTYLHMLLDHHEIIFAEGAPTETLLTGPGTLKAIGAEALAELTELFPELLVTSALPARPTPSGKKVKALIGRHFKNSQPLLQV